MSSTAVAPPELLVVEDDVEILTVVQEALEEEGCMVTPATSLPASLALLSERPFHLVLTDLFRAEGQGMLQSLYPLLAKAAPIPVGIITAWPITPEKASLAGASFLLRKPFELDDLVRIIQRELSAPPGHERQTSRIEQFFAALNEQNWQQLALLCTPGLMLVPVSAPPLVASDPRHGLLSLRTTLEQRFRSLPGYTFEDVRVYGRPIGLAARYTARWQSRDGSMHRVAGSLQFRFQGERIASIEGAF